MTISRIVFPHFVSFSLCVVSLAGAMLAGGTNDSGETIRRDNRLGNALSSTSASAQWAFLSGRVSKVEPVETGAISIPAIFEPAEKAGVRWASLGGRVATAEPSIDGEEELYAVASYTIPAGASGFYSIADTFIRRDATQQGEIDLRVFVRHSGASAAQQPAPVVATSLSAGELFDFDCFLGYLGDGDVVYVAIGPKGDAAGDRVGIDFTVQRVPFIPVSDFPGDYEHRATTPTWSIASDVSMGSVAARELAFGQKPTNPTLSLSGTPDRDTVIAFRVPQSGYYALHDSVLSLEENTSVVVHVFAGAEASPRRTFTPKAGVQKVTIDTDIGYVAKGDLIHVAFASSVSATIDFKGTIIEWAPRRAPLRVARSANGAMRVFEPEAPRRAIEVPEANWVTVPASKGDATDAIRGALKKAQVLQRRAGANAYAGIRLEAGKTYDIASQQTKGTIFSLVDAQRIIFDGNGATLCVKGPEFSRTTLTLFSLNNSRNVVFADLIVSATTIPFTTGEIIDVTPRGKDPQVVTFRVDPGALDPIKDISRNGRNNAYAYDPKIPGRLALGTWTHYPGYGDSQIEKTDTPNVFTHRVTRTGNSIEPGNKWLIKNKNAALDYLSTGGTTENVTFSNITGLAPGGGILRFWQTSGVNILNCRFEPEGTNWISSSSDGVHGRGREGVWIENTLIRGICEDIMNTYGQNMIVVADDNPNDTTMTIRMFTRGSESFDDGAKQSPGAENVLPGDQLVFFDPQTGRVLGYAHVLSINKGRFTLSNPVPGITFSANPSDKYSTKVYNTRVAGRFFVRDSRFMDSMRFGIYIKARGGVVFGSQFEGLSAPSIFAVNEPEWPEGPPATHLWVQGCTFSQNNFGYMSRHRDFMVVDPADISVYTRRFRAKGEPADHTSHLTHGQYANSNMKFIGNVFHDWRGMGISVRNAHNVRIEDNVFLSPVNDEVMRKTLAVDPLLSDGGRGAYAAVHLDSVIGADVRGNSFLGLPKGDIAVARGNDVQELTGALNKQAPIGAHPPVLELNFSEWFGITSGEGQVTLNSGRHHAGRIGAGLQFTGGAPATLAASKDFGGRAFEQFTLALWACPESTDGVQTIVDFGDAQNGVSISIDAERWRATLCHGGKTTQLDLGAVTPGQWRHIALIYDGPRNTMRAYMDGIGLGTVDSLPAVVTFPEVTASLGANYRGLLDEVRFYPAVITPADLAALALRGLR